MTTTEVHAMLSSVGIIPIIAIDRVDQALPLADALLAAGLPIIEITFRTAVASEVIRLLARERPNLLVGAGTVLTRETAEAAKEAGAKFALAPGLNPATVKCAAELGLPFMPGVATPSEVELALCLGCRTLKLFPAELLGGVEMLNALLGPYGHTGVNFIPTGGISPANLDAYLGCKAVAAVGGTWLAKKEDLSGGRWADIQRRCAEAVENVRRRRSMSQRRA
jgi:2-dehydro-3-deoxyphosphogluconate aldolase / (4S)-4-hydroxy-2-oxoglutarate aldolase